MCLSSLVTQRPLEEFCCSATFLDLSLSLLTAGRPPSSSPSFPLFTLPVPLKSCLSTPACAIGGSHFHVSGAPISVTAPCPPVSLETASLVWEAAGEAIGARLSPNPGTVRSALLTPVNQIIIWLDLTSTHALICTYEDAHWSRPPFFQLTGSSLSLQVRQLNRSDKKNEKRYIKLDYIYRLKKAFQSKCPTLSFYRGVFGQQNYCTCVLSSFVIFTGSVS